MRNDIRYLPGYRLGVLVVYLLSDRTVFIYLSDWFAGPAVDFKLFCLAAG